MTEGGPLIKAFGPEAVTAYSGNPLNRLSFLREDQAFLQAALHSEDALLLPFKDFNALLNSNRSLKWLTLADIGSDVIGEPYDSSTTSARLGVHAQLVFLGIDERVKSEFASGEYRGAPRFAVDVNVYDNASSELKTKLENLVEKLTEGGDEFQSVMFGPPLSDRSDYAIIAEARIILDWINRNRFCGGCGARNIPSWGGFKLVCSLAASEGPESEKCPSKGKLTNLSFPRTDTCVIAAVVSHDGQRVLIGRNKRFPGQMYSTLAGFLEPGESIEDCVRREIWEEAGVRVGRVLLYATQPWPYPANLMVGCVAEIADSSAKSHEICLGHDKELADAKWVTLQQLRDAFDGNAEFNVPPKPSIAHLLLHSVAYGTVYKPNL